MDKEKITVQHYLYILKYPIVLTPLPCFCVWHFFAFSDDTMFKFNENFKVARFNNSCNH